LPYEDSLINCSSAPLLLSVIGQNGTDKMVTTFCYRFEFNLYFLNKRHK